MREMDLILLLILCKVQMLGSGNAAEIPWWDLRLEILSTNPMKKTTNV